MPDQHCQTVGLSPLPPVILLLGLWLLYSPAASQEICSSPGTLPAPRLFLNKLSAHQGDTVVLSCLVPLDTPMTRIVFCKDGKELSVQPKEGNKPIYDLPHTVSKESAGDFSCRYQLKDDNNQENNSLPSDPCYLHVADLGTSTTPYTTPGKEHHHSCVSGIGLIPGLTFIAGLALGLLVCFVLKTVVRHHRTQRNPGPNQNSPNSEDQIDYTEVTSAHTDQQSIMDRDRGATYAVVKKGGCHVYDTHLAV